MEHEHRCWHCSRNVACDSLRRRYLRIVWSAAQCDNDTNEAIIRASRQLGFLTGDESPVMNAAHVSPPLQALDAHAWCAMRAMS